MRADVVLGRRRLKLERVGNKRHLKGGPRPSFTTLKRIFNNIQRGLRWTGADVSKPIELKVHFAKDEETGRWYIADSDIPGLRVEADSADELIRKVEDVAPDLIELNADEIMAKVRSRVSARALPARKHKTSKAVAHRPAVTIRPVFDSTMAVACV